MATCYLIKDMNGKIAPNTLVTTRYGSRTLSATSDNKGIAKFEAALPDNAVIVVPGYGTATKVNCEQPPTTTPTPSPGTPEGYMNAGAYGNSCTHLRKSIGAHVAEFIRDDKTGTISYGTEDWPSLTKSTTVKNFHCELPMPTPSTKTADEVSKEVSLLSGIVNDALDVLDAIKKVIEGIIEDIKNIKNDISNLINVTIKNIVTDIELVKDAIGNVIENEIPNLWDSIDTIKSDIADVINFIDNIDAWLESKLNDMKDIIIGWIEAAFIGIVERVLEHEKPK